MTAKPGSKKQLFNQSVIDNDDSVSLNFGKKPSRKFKNDEDEFKPASDGEISE